MMNAIKCFFQIKKYTPHKSFFYLKLLIFHKLSQKQLFWLIEFDRNPNILGTIKLLSLKWATSLLNSTFSNTFGNEGSNEICVLLPISFLSPF